jgi:hypothetical protein
MTVGGTHPVSKVMVKDGIGWEKSEKVWYRANAKYFIQTTDFAQAAQGVRQAAIDLGLTPAEIGTIDCAFQSTGITQGACSGMDATFAGEPVERTSRRQPSRRRSFVTYDGGCSTAGSSRSSSSSRVPALLAVMTLLAAIGLRRRSAA